MTTNRTGTTPFPRYRAIADSLRQEIAGGIHPLGTMLPSERELRDRFSVARGTARDGLRRLGQNPHPLGIRATATWPGAWARENSSQ